MSEIINKTLEMFVMFIIGVALGVCFMYSHMRDKGVQEEKAEITNSVLTENDIEKIRNEGKKDAEELIVRIESNTKKENEILAIAEAKVKAGIPLIPEERAVFERKIYLEEFHKVMDKR